MFSLFVLALAPLSSFAEERPDAMSVTSDLRTAEPIRDGRAWDLEGTVLAVAPDGDSFVIQTRRDRIHVEARGGVRVYYRGRAYRVRDLERGDRVAVDLTSRNARRPRARSVEVISSVRHDRQGRYDDRHRDRYDDRYGDRRLAGRVVSLDARRDRMVVRTSSGREYAVDAGRLRRTHGSSWERGIRIGDWIELEGAFRGQIFVAEWIGRDGRSDHDRYGRR